MMNETDYLLALFIARFNIRACSRFSALRKSRGDGA